MVSITNDKIRTAENVVLMIIDNFIFYPPNGSAVDPQALSFRAGGVQLSGWHLIPPCFSGGKFSAFLRLSAPKLMSVASFCLFSRLFSCFSSSGDGFTSLPMSPQAVIPTTQQISILMICHKTLSTVPNQLGSQGILHFPNSQAKMAFHISGKS